jgi:hypothetical protein
MNVQFGLLVFYYDIDFMFFLAVELKKKNYNCSNDYYYGSNNDYNDDDESISVNDDN